MKPDHLTVRKLIALIPNHPNQSTVFRWCKKGLIAPNGERVRLEHSKAGGRMVVTPAAYREFKRKLGQ